MRFILINSIKITVLYRETILPFVCQHTDARNVKLALVKIFTFLETEK